MSQNPNALRIARDTGRSYDEVRRCLNLAEWEGWTIDETERFIRELPSGTSAFANIQAALAAGKVSQA